MLSYLSSVSEIQHDSWYQHGPSMDLCYMSKTNFICSTENYENENKHPKTSLNTNYLKKKKKNSKTSLLLIFIYLGASYHTLKCSVTLTVCNPKDCSPPGSSCLGFSRQEYWRGLPLSSPEGLPSPRDQILISCTAGRLFTV